VTRGHLDLSEVHEVELFEGELERYRLKAGDLLVVEGNGTLSQLGRGAMWRGQLANCVHQNHLIRVRVTQAMNPQYLEYLWNSPLIATQIEKVGASTSGLHTLSVSKLRPLTVPVPPLAEQHRIVAALDEYFTHLDAGVELIDKFHLRQRIDSFLLEYAVTGKLSNTLTTDGPASDLITQSRNWVSGHRKVRRLHSRQLPAGASAVLARATIPTSWEWAEWQQLGFSKNGAPFSSSDYQQSGVRLIRPGNLGVCGFVTWAPTNTESLPESYAHKHPSLVVPADSLIMNLTAQSLKGNFLGRTCIKLDRDPALLNQRLAWLKPALMNVRYLWLVFRSPLFRMFVNRLNSGSLIQHIHTWQIERFMVPVPPLEEQARIVARYEELSSRIAKANELVRMSTNRVQVLRIEILVQAFSGKLVPQDSTDETALVLLERIKAERAAQPKAKRARRSPKNTNQEQGSLL